jgi:hypothetical protein
VVMLTHQAAVALGVDVTRRDGLLSVVMPP